MGAGRFASAGTTLPIGTAISGPDRLSVGRTVMCVPIVAVPPVTSASCSGSTAVTSYTVGASGILDIMECFEYFREFVRTLPEPVELHSGEGAEFGAEFRYHRLGSAEVMDWRMTGRVRVGVRRGPRLIRQSDPECYRLAISMQGHAGMSQDGRHGVLGPGDIGVYDTSRPLRAGTGPTARPGC